jgi:hypothetical protein
MSTETKVAHTPGPWTARESSLSQDGNLWFIHADITRAHSGRVAEAWNEANASLVAAAPELLEALREVVASWDGTRDVIGPTIKAKLARADAAIAKAEGL